MDSIIPMSRHFSNYNKPLTLWFCSSTILLTVSSHLWFSLESYYIILNNLNVNYRLRFRKEIIIYLYIQKQLLKFTSSVVASLDAGA